MVQVKSDAVIDALRQVGSGWGIKPVCFPYGDAARAETLLGLKALDRLFTDVRIPEEMYKIMVDGRAQSPRLYSMPVRLEDQVVFRALDPSRLYAALRTGASLLIAGVNELWPPVRDLCTSITGETGLQCSSFAFVSPARGKGFVPHIDRTDQLVIQCAGSKDWTVYEVVSDPALRGKRIEADGLGQVTFQGTLKVGDMLYIPVGAPHAAFASQEFSAHLTLIFEPLTLEASMRKAIDSLVSQDSRLTRPLPPFYREDMDRLVGALASSTAELASRLPDQSVSCFQSAIHS